MSLIFYPLYYIAWSLAIPILALLSTTAIPKWRRGLRYKLGYLDPEKFIKPSNFNKLTNDFAKPIWFHAVSVGELNALLPLLRVFAGSPMVLSVTTDTAYTMAESKLKNEITNNLIKLIYMPWDHPHIISSVLERINPRAIILMESEIWPALIFEASQRKIKIIIANAKLSDASYKTYKLFSPFISWVFRNISLILVQTPQDSRKYIDMKVDKNKIYMTGNMKFSALPNVKLDKVAKLRSALGYTEKNIIWVCGSTHSEEEILLTAIFQELKEELPELRLILAPRHPERFEVVESIINSAAQLNLIKLSRIKDNIRKSRQNTSKLSSDEILHHMTITDDDGTDKNLLNTNDVLLIDTIGDLMNIYSIADIAFVGGTINNSVGGHNVLEPAACRVPVVIGPNYYKNTQMVEMMEEAGALIVADAKEDLRVAVLDLAMNHDKRVLMGAEAKNLTDRNKRIVVDVAELIKKEIY